MSTDPEQLNTTPTDPPTVAYVSDRGGVNTPAYVDLWVKIVTSLLTILATACVFTHF